MTLATNDQRGSGATFTLKYPGHQQPVTVTARVDGVGASDQQSVGFDVYDGSGGTAPAERATLANNQAASNPNLMQLTYAGDNGGPVMFKFFNYSGSPVTVTVTPVVVPEPISLTGLLGSTFQSLTSPTGAPAISA
jgi:hypothetical protein